MTGNCKRGEEEEPEGAIVATLRKMARSSEDEADGDSVLSVTSPSIVAPRKCQITEEKKATAAALLLSTTKDAKVDAPTCESSAPTFTTQRSLPTALVDPTKLIPHASLTHLSHVLWSRRWARP